MARGGRIVPQRPEVSLERQMEILERGVDYLKANVFGPEDTRNYPEKFSDLLLEQRFAEKSKVVNQEIPWMLSEIQDLPPKAAMLVRKIMQAETKVRGAAPKLLTEKIDIFGEATDVKKLPGDTSVFDKNKFYTELEPDPISSTLRGTLYHGRTTLPEGTILGKIGEEKLATKITAPDPYKPIGEEGIVQEGIQARIPDLRGARGKKMNIGEPTGISLSSSPVVAHKFSKRPGNEFARVMPLYGQPPEEVIINAWTESGGKVMKEAYLDAAKALKGRIKRKGIKGQDKIYKPLEEMFPKIQSNQEFKQFIGGRGLTTEFNELLTRSLQKKGYKGILYSPHRFDEFELKLFDPGDALVVDRRKMIETKKEGFGLVNKTFNRMGFYQGKIDADLFGNTKTMKTLEDLTTAAPSSLRDWYSQLDVAKELGLRKGPEVIGEGAQAEAKFLGQYGLGPGGIPALQKKHPHASAMLIKELKQVGMKIDNVPGEGLYQYVDNALEGQTSEDLWEQVHKAWKMHEKAASGVDSKEVSKYTKMLKDLGVADDVEVDVNLDKAIEKLYNKYIDSLD